MAGEDAALPSPSPHRLPTVSASQALHNFHARGARSVSSGIPQLDKILCPPSLPGHHVSGGYMRGKVTEVFGPSGVGKTALGIQAAVSALREDQHVVWVDAACAPLVQYRIDNVLSGADNTPLQKAGVHPIESSGASLQGLRSRFHYFATPTLAHLLALFMHAPASFPPKHTGLVVVDSIATLVDNAYPRHADDRAKKTDQTRWAAGRRFAVINDMIAMFTKLAALHDIALLVTCQTITRIRGSSRALLVPAISGIEWENGVSTRLVLFRDWVQQAKASETEDVDKLLRARFVGLVKANGIVIAEEGGTGTVIPFTVETSGLCDMSITTDKTIAPVVYVSHTRPPKRPFADMDEGAGEEPSSDELYGWIEDDEVAAEGLLIDERSVAHDPNAIGRHLDVVADGHNKKVETLLLGDECAATVLIGELPQT